MYLRTMDDGGGGKPRAVCTVADAVRRLGRSQRHICRYMREGVLKPRGRLLGQWLLDPGEVDILARPLDLGGVVESRWILRRYPPALIRRFLEDDGLRCLSPKSFRFWSLYFDANPSNRIIPGPRSVRR